MPCNSDYMEPNLDEQNSHETAKNLKYVLESLERPVPRDVSAAARSGYGCPEELENFVVSLCSILNSLTSEEADRIIYNGRSPKARQLADWWDEHQEADRQREEKELSEKGDAALVESALSKLTEEEREALKRSL